MRKSFTSTEQLEPELIVNRYGIGVDCLSRFFQICALAGRDDVVLKYKDKCEAACKVAILYSRFIQPYHPDTVRLFKPTYSGRGLPRVSGRNHGTIRPRT
jgi:hypothetical protein